MPQNGGREEMNSIVKRVLVVVLALVLFGLPACDTGDGEDQGGGTATAGIYSKASLAGVWDFVKRYYANGNYITFAVGTVNYDEQGNIISRTNSGCGMICAGNSINTVLSEEITVNPDGTYHGKAITRCNCTSPIFYSLITFDGEFTSPTSRKTWGVMIGYNLAVGKIISTQKIEMEYTKRQ